MIRFCSSGTVGGADLDAEVAARDHHRVGLGEDLVERVDRLGLLDLRDHVRRRAGRLDQRLAGLRRRRRSGRTRARRSRRRARARTRGRRGPSASATGSAAARPGRLTPLCELTVPPTSTAQRARPRSTSLDAQPDGAVVDQHVVARAGARRRARPARSAGRRPAARPRPATSPRRRARARRGSSSSPTRSFGPCRSAISASGRPSSLLHARGSPARARRGPRACRARS